MTKCNYEQLLDPEIFRLAYELKKSKSGNMKPGADKETLDGFSQAYVEKVVRQLKDESFQFRPSRREFIPKADGKLRSLGIPSPRDKIVQEVMRRILEPVFEPRFLDSSHGFRPHRSPHTALRQIRRWTGTSWMIEGDIKGYFDNIDHHLLAGFIAELVKDQRLLGLYWKLVRAGYVNQGKAEPHLLTGVPQGRILSPLLSNIYLHQFDLFMEEIKVKYTTTGALSKNNPIYSKARNKYYKLVKSFKASSAEIIRARRDMLKMTYGIQTGSRVRYVRYADDWVIGVTGPKALAVQIKEEVSTFLQEKLKLSLQAEKTRITNLSRSEALFLGTLISITSRKYVQSQKVGGGHRRASLGRIRLCIPIDILIGKLSQMGACDEKGTPKAVTKWIFLNVGEIINKYMAVFRGYYNYYSFADDIHHLLRIIYILRYSAINTVARKLGLNTAKVIKRFGVDLIFRDHTNEIKHKLNFPRSLPNKRMNFALSPPSDPRVLFDTSCARIQC
ncbi:hypothetical protein Mp_Mg00800 (mitochondrion) [Marchantia polymorpha subsp. ruderalis]|uniref:Uncharacterized protein n=2 Tax=Marchantia polymorpha TaxID=3197 RepID=A0A2Z6DTH0_MARPO|nr:hypothetical protein MpKit2_Mp058 [Marchantia polymorpha subsp. ruderalis]QBE89504.1 hypothetical protein [Marchantia polymorpha subsp. ruderalis]BBD75194.1 hypothetical protein MpKit2_Mp058 [Marchantia polymorpha subsp. ruderalis]BDD77377.1 hypothetical protein Mp_Mg00800 [Marchantia polymorpha subsp. ruderalis]